MVPASLNDRFVIRFCVCAQKATKENIKYAYDVISQFACDLITILQMEAAQKRRVARISTLNSIAAEAAETNSARLAVRAGAAEPKLEIKPEEQRRVPLPTIAAATATGAAAIETELEEEEELPIEAGEETTSRDLQELSKEDDDSVDEVVMLDRKKKKSLRYKRSFFVRRVSDPKLYNPKIVRAFSCTGQQPAHSRQTSNDSDTGVVTPL